MRIGFFLLIFFSTAAEATVVPLHYRVVATHPHAIAHFTQGLVLDGKRLFESSGGYGRSALIEVDRKSGKPLRQQPLPAPVFAEGLTLFGGRLLQLSWREGRGFVYDRELRLLHEFRYRGEGWGLTQDGRRLILSDGTATLRFLHPKTFEETGSLAVHQNGVPVSQLNELEYARGKIWANVWHQSRIVAIDATNGRVTATLDLSGLSRGFDKPPGWNPAEDVLNGIAYDADTDRFLVTGKRWPLLFELDVHAPR